MAIKKLIRFDWAIKYILRNKANFDVLEGFLSNLLKEEIVILEILESESNQEAENRKFNRVDLKCKDSTGRQIIIEIQNQREVDYLQRILWGTSKAIIEGFELGSKYKDVVKVISISILYHKMRLDETENTDFIYYGTTNLVGLHNNKPLVLHEAIKLGEKATVVTGKDVFPEYYMIYVEKFQDMINDALDEWVYFFKYGKIRDDFKSPGILLAANKLDYITMKEEDRYAYDSYLAYLGQEIGILESAKEEGREEGIAKGIELGRKEGEKNKAIEIAKNIIDLADDETIALKTGLSVEYVASIRKDINA